MMGARSAHRRPSSVQVGIGKRVRALREANGLGQTELASLANMSRSHLSALESGHAKKVPNVSSLEALARALKVRIADLLPEDEQGVSASPTGSTRALVNLVNELRGRPTEFLRLVTQFVRFLDSAKTKTP